MDVWQVSLDRPPEEVAFLRDLLSPEERQRAEAFHFDKDRRRYAVARGALRAILADCLRTTPQALRFEQGQNGKPYLAGGPGFNLSHCEDLALIAVAADSRAVGVDVERVRPLQELSSIEERYFSAEERAFLAAAAPAERRAFLAAAAPTERPRAFLTLWTRREAAAKALGLDLQAALAKVKIPAYVPGGTALADLGGDSSWFLCDIALDADHVGALCVLGRLSGVTLQFYSPRLR